MLCTDCHRLVKPVVSVDIDGTLANYHLHFFRFAAQWLGVDSRIWNHFLGYDGSVDIATYMDISKETYRKIKLAYRQGGMKRSMPRMPGAQELLTGLWFAEAEIWLTTTRPYLQIGNVDEDTRAWLDRNFLRYDHLLYTDQKYTELTQMVEPERIAAVLEDQVYPEYSEARSLGLPALLVCTSYNVGAIQKAGSTASNIPDVVDSLHEAKERMKTMVAQWKEKHHART